MATEQQHSVKANTEYVILKEQDSAWVAAGIIAARDAEAAIRAKVATLNPDDQDGRYVAVPARSWKPLPVAVKVERSLVIGGAA